MIKVGEVWLVETGEYEGRYIFGIYDSYDSAIVGIKDKFSPPYVVVWEKSDDGLTGHFEEVNGYSIRHTAQFDIQPDSVLGLTPQ